MRYYLLILFCDFFWGLQAQPKDSSVGKASNPPIIIAWERSESVEHSGAINFKELTKFHFLYKSNEKYPSLWISVPDSTAMILSYDLVISSNNKEDTFQITSQNFYKDYSRLAKGIKPMDCICVINIQYVYQGQKYLYRLEEGENLTTCFK